LNQYLTSTPFHLETVSRVKQMAQVYRWLATLDISNAFCHVPVRRDHQTLLGINLFGRYYCFQSMPFGLNLSPFAWSLLIGDAATLLRRSGVPVVIYVDDIAVFAMTAQECEFYLAWVRVVLRQLGIQVNPQKGQPPSQRATFIGFVIDLRLRVLAVPRNKVDRIRGQAASLLRRGGAPVREWLQLAGRIVATAPACPMAMVATRSLFNLTVRRPMPQWVYLTKAARADLALWSRFPVPYRSRPLDDPAAQMVVATDAQRRWAGLVAPLDRSSAVQLASAPFSERMQAQIIAVRELQAFLNTLLSDPRLRGAPLTIHHFIDNQVARAIEEKTASRSPVLHRIERRIVEFCVSEGHVLKTHYLPSLLNPSDQASRLGGCGSYLLHPRLFAYAQRALNLCCTFDRYGTPTAHQPLSCAPQAPTGDRPWLDPTRQDWTGEISWVHPPFDRLSEALTTMWVQGASGLVVAPVWPSFDWWPLLLRLADRVLLLPPDRSLFSSGRSHRPMPPPSWPVAVFRIPPRPPAMVDLRESAAVVAALDVAVRHTATSLASRLRSGNGSPRSAGPHPPPPLTRHALLQFSRLWSFLA
jgi:hypothetical protein